jgi:modification methylase
LIANPKFKLAPKANAFGDVWEFPQEMNNAHPAPFPVALIERIISSTQSQLILDPFMGSGTTAVAAKRLGRKFIGIEISPEYCELAEERLSQSSLDSSVVKSDFKKVWGSKKKKIDLNQMSMFDVSQKEKVANGTF